MDEVTFARLARQAGFGRTGFCSARAFEAEREAVALGPEIAERRQLKFDPIGDDERTKSLAVLLWPYNPAEKEEKGREEYEWCFKICRCITFSDGHSTHGPLAVVPQSNGERRSQARTDTFCKIINYRL